MGEIVIEYTDASYAERRLKFTPREQGSGYWLVEDVLSDGDWIQVGREAVNRVTLEENEDALV